jgi:hypothetical protein
MRSSNRRRILDLLAAAVLCNPYWILNVIHGMDKIKEAQNHFFKEKDLNVWNGTTFIQRKVI